MRHQNESLGMPDKPTLQFLAVDKDWAGAIISGFHIPVPRNFLFSYI